MPRHKNQMWWIVSESVPTLPGVLWILQHEWILCYRVWQLWRQKINRITRAFMKADLAGKTGEHMAGQVLSRSDRYWQWLYLGCAEIPFSHQQSAPRRAARVTAVRCRDAQLIRRWLVYSKVSHSWGQDISKETEGLLCLLCSREWRDDQELAWELY